MSTQLFDLSGRVALISGASRGIGESIAKLLAEQGARVIVTSRKLEGCLGVAEAINAAGGAAEALDCDVGKLEDIERTVEHVKNRYGRLDILINNAAANPYYGYMLDIDLASFQKTVDVNIRGFFFMSVAAAKVMREQGSGSIVNTASVNAISPAIKQGVYSITKAAVVSMTKAFAKECGSIGIRVNALLPGFTKTKFAGALFDDDGLYKSIVGMIPMRRHAEPDEMAGAVLYLVSDAASYTTGECLVVDGGMTI
ncbi:SDR family oxidoreductase [Microbulbifer hainanensis]|uniref:SDR family oxidoreductase n=1 Tax=Microbulbifer hainanensis TaxID=2735675 RepID=UPI001868B355|nr:SDR family oxidoreductase [Microbulbifer hainanensis]